MNICKRWGLTGFMLLGSTLLFSQDFSDVLRYSQMFPQTTARSMAIGNAVGAVGADFSCLNINPAGIGLYRKNEFEVTANFNHDVANSNYLNSQSTNDRYNFNVGSLAFVWGNIRTTSDHKPVKQGWVTTNYALGFSRINSFSSNATLEADNRNSSITQGYMGQANGFTSVQLGAGGQGVPPLASMAYNGYLINPDNSSPTIWHSIIEEEKSTNVHQLDQFTTRGAMNEINFGVGANYSNKFYIGASIFAPIVGYHFYREFVERNNNPNPVAFQSMTEQDSVNTTGAGISGNVGLIYRPNETFRFGLAAQLPMFLYLKDVYSNNLSSVVLQSGASTFYSFTTGTNYYNYSIITPPKVTASGAMFFDQNGFVSVDLDYIDYTNSKLNVGLEETQFATKQIRQYLTNALNVRVGGELRLDPFYLRAGFDYYGSPYAKDSATSTANGSSFIYSFGIGYKDKKIFMDLTYQLRQTNYFYQPYDLPAPFVAQGATISDNLNSFIFTIGTRF